MAKIERCRSRIATLQQDLLFTIAKRLPSRVDILRFRAVCFSFRKSCPLPPKTLSPHSFVIPVPSGPYDPPSSDLSEFVLNEYVVYAFEPIKKVTNPYKTKTWIVNVEELTSGKIGVSDPLSGYVTKLKELHEKSLNLLDFKVMEVAKVHRLGLVEKVKEVDESEEGEEVDEGEEGEKGEEADDGEEGDEGEKGEEVDESEEGEEGDEIIQVSSFEIVDKDEEKKRIKYFPKVVVSKSLDEIGNGFALMCMNEGVVDMWRSGDDNWININNYVDKAYIQDICYHNNKFYAIAAVGLTFTVDSDSLKVTNVVEKLPESDVRTLKFLVKSCNDLYLIVRHSYPIEYKLLKLDEEKHEWVQFDRGLEDRLLFVGDWSSFSCKEVAGCKGNRLYITYDKFGASTFDMSTKRSDDCIPLWFCPEFAQIFMPPTWLKLRK